MVATKKLREKKRKAYFGLCLNIYETHMIYLFLSIIQFIKLFVSNNFIKQLLIEFIIRLSLSSFFFLILALLSSSSASGSVSTSGTVTASASRSTTASAPGSTATSTSGSATALASGYPTASGSALFSL